MFPEFFLFTPLEYLLMFIAVLYGMTIRSITGFGGITITLPLLLLFNNNPLLFLPILVMQAMFVYIVMFFQERKNIKIKWVKKIFPILILFYIFGLIFTIPKLRLNITK